MSQGSSVTHATVDVVVGRRYEAVAYSDDATSAGNLIEAERRHDFELGKDALDGSVLPEPVACRPGDGTVVYAVRAST